MYTYRIHIYIHTYMYVCVYIGNPFYNFNNADFEKTYILS